MEVFKKQLDNLEKLFAKLKKTSSFQKKLTAEAIRFNKALDTVKRTADKLYAVFNRIFGVIKNIAFGSAFGTGLLAIKGVMGQKEVLRGKKLDLNAQQMGALRHAGGKEMADREFFISLTENLKKNLYTPDKVGDWAKLGINQQMASKMDTIELLKTFIQQAKAREGGDIGQNQILQSAIESLGGIDLGTLKTMDLDKITSAYKEGLTLTDRSAEKLSALGKGVNSLITSLDGLVNKTLSSIAPALGKVFDSISKGLGKITQSKEFSDMMEKISEWALGIAKNFDQKMIEGIKEIPAIMRGIQLVFYKILSGLATAAQIFTLGMNDDVNEFKKWASEGAKNIELKNRFEEVQKSQSIPEWEQKVGDYIETKGKDLSKEEQESFSKRYAELRQMPPINITIQNDPTQGIVQKNLTDALNFGGLSYPAYQGMGYGSK